MNMLGEVERILGAVDISTSYRLVNIGGNKLYIEGIKAVGYIRDDEILVRLKSKELLITGERLKIKYLDKSTIVIEGHIRLVEER